MIERMSPNSSLSLDARRWLPFAAALLLLVVAVAMLVVMLLPDLPVPSAGSAAGLDASSARWAALGRYYSRQRALSADSARWQALGRSYTRLERSNEASSARWQALGESFTALGESGTPAGLIGRSGSGRVRWPR